MSDSINLPPSLPPASPHSERPNDPSPKGAGANLFKQASDFYSWHLATVQDPKSNASVYRTLSNIMRIAKVSADGANYLTPSDEEEAQSAFTDLSENLTYGGLSTGDVHHSLTHILATLKEDNPHAKLIGTSTDLEYRISIENDDDLGDRLASDFNDQFDKLEQKVIGGTTKFQAETLSRDLSSLVQSHDPSNPDETLRQLTHLLNHWP
ncbi:MAG: hypothetical protein SP1CHLAM54_02750 [Chlamydiia bacterium]|nr:hypothetical protein [Chlamydiia bacterium]MCH9615191.1 hypothetical protein [Chlamydiia bacterium]MCH9628487.1 hypothetical protein [Chlamydiia bacterium]